MLNDVGAEVYQTWSYEQRRNEIDKLVQGYRNGLPIEFLCMMATSIAGSELLAREHLIAIIPPEERQIMVGKASGKIINRFRIRSFLY
jgi:hypothetical protein